MLAISLPVPKFSIIILTTNATQYYLITYKCRLLSVCPSAVWWSVDLNTVHHSYSGLLQGGPCGRQSCRATGALSLSLWRPSQPSILTLIIHFNFYMTPLLVCRRLAGAAFAHTDSGAPGLTYFILLIRSSGSHQKLRLHVSTTIKF